MPNCYLCLVRVVNAYTYVCIWWVQLRVSLQGTYVTASSFLVYTQRSILIFAEAYVIELTHDRYSNTDFNRTITKHTQILWVIFFQATISKTEVCQILKNKLRLKIQQTSHRLYIQRDYVTCCMQLKKQSQLQDNAL